MPPKKTKFVSINAVDSNSALLPGMLFVDRDKYFKQMGIFDHLKTIAGRHRCECQATKHALINNCLSCGRIVCAQEGKGPCFWCGELVRNDNNMLMILR